MLADLDGDSDLLVRHFRGDKVDQLLARTDGTDAASLLTDFLGSIRDVIDNSGTVVDSVTYDSFGNAVAETSSADRGRYGWTSREYDTEIDLQFNRARYYDAATGRWISQDPLGFNAGDSNLFRYLQNQSIQKVDPSGLLPDPLWNLLLGLNIADNAAPTLTARSVVEPAMFTHGLFWWPIQWSLNMKSDKTNGGFILQHIDADFTMSDRQGTFLRHPVDNGRWHYWEAWRVDPDKDMPILSRKAPRVVATSILNAYVAAHKFNANVENQKWIVENILPKIRPFSSKAFSEKVAPPFHDVFAVNIGSTPSSEPVVNPFLEIRNGDTKGTVTFVGHAYYIDNISKLPDAFRIGGADNAGQLLSMLDSDPKSAEAIRNLFSSGRWRPFRLEHSIQVSWDNTSPQPSWIKAESKLISYTQFPLIRGEAK